MTWGPTLTTKLTPGALLLGLVMSCQRPDPRALPSREGSLPNGTEVVSFTSEQVKLGGLLLRPAGAGPFPALLYNHGSAPGDANDLAFANLGPAFVARGWVFFMPYRRGQGLSRAAGPYIEDEVRAARDRGGKEAATRKQLELLNGEHLDDQLAALSWLRRAPFVRGDRVATAGNSYGGIEALLGAERGDYCAAIDAAGAAQSWAESAELRARLLTAAKGARAPVFFFQAANDFDLSPSQELSAAMQAAGKRSEVRIYPPFGNSAADGHSFPYRGPALWVDDALRFIERECPR